MASPSGESYDAKFDGKDYPVEGDPGHTMVSLKRISASPIEEVDKRDGKVVAINRMTVARTASRSTWISPINCTGPRPRSKWRPSRRGGNVCDNGTK
jgi:hypothetical protein